MQALSTRLVIGIPIHGCTPELSRTLEAIYKNVLFIGTDSVQLIIANSFARHSAPVDYGFSRQTELVLSEYSYWSGSVSAIYREYRDKSYRCPLLLMNHDCVPGHNCISNLLEESEKHSLYAIHAQLNYLHDPSKIWWLGSQIGLLGTCSIPQSQTLCIKSSLILSSSTMGQCLLIHPDLIDSTLLYKSVLPHYFADSVQTTLMRRKGAIVGVLRTAIAFTDQSDYEKKLNRWYSGHIYLFIHRTLFAPWSNRLITARVFSTYVEIDNKIQAILAAIFVAFATVAITLKDLMVMLLMKLV